MSSPSHLLACVLQLLVTLLAILAASSTLKIVSMLLPSSLSALVYLVQDFTLIFVYVLSFISPCFHFIHHHHHTSLPHIPIYYICPLPLYTLCLNDPNFAAIVNGYPTFVVSILAIGMCTAVIGDIAGHLGCFINLKDCVNAIAFVALGTSVPG